MEAAEQLENKGFDLKVTHRDEKTDEITHKTPYTLWVIDRRKLWERPVGSGNIWDKKGNAIGRLVVDPKTRKAEFKEGVEHMAFVAPETEDQKLARSLIDKDRQIKALEAELMSMKAETKKKQGS